MKSHNCKTMVSHMYESPQHPSSHPAWLPAASQSARLSPPHHNGVLSLPSQLPDAVNRTPVKLHRAPDPIHARPEHHHRTPGELEVTGLAVVRQVKVVCECGIFRGNCVDLFDVRPYVAAVAEVAHR